MHAQALKSFPEGASRETLMVCLLQALCRVSLLMLLKLQKALNAISIILGDHPTSSSTRWGIPSSSDLRAL